MDEMELQRLREKIYNLCVEQVKTKENINIDYLHESLGLPEDTRIELTPDKEIKLTVNRKVNIIEIELDEEDLK